MTDLPIVSDPAPCDPEFHVRTDDQVAGRDGVARRFRDVLGRFASGVTVVTGTGEDGPVGLTVQGFMSVSLDPPLVVFAAARTSRAWPVIERSGGYCVNLLAADQQQVAEVMATRGADKFRHLAWTPSKATGSPVLAGGLGHVDCTIERVDDGGDHVLVLGRVVGLAATAAADALLYQRGRYGSTQAG